MKKTSKKSLIVQWVLIIGVGYWGYTAVAAEMQKQQAEPLTAEEMQARQEQAEVRRQQAEARKQQREQSKNEQLAIFTAEEMVRSQMRAPRTTKFKGSFYRKHGAGHVVCGMVNSQNGFGGMSGFQPYVSINGRLVTIGDAKTFNTYCVG